MKKACVILSLLLMYNCDVKNKNTSLFNIKDINLNIKDIEKKGFKRVFNAGSFMYNKQKKDTLIIFELEDKINKHIINTKTWKIKLKSSSKEYVKKHIMYGKAYIITPIADYNDKEYFFTVVDVDYSNTFVCKVIEENNLYYLDVTYYNPHKVIGSNENTNIDEDNIEVNIPKANY